MLGDERHATVLELVINTMKYGYSWEEWKKETERKDGNWTCRNVKGPNFE